MNSVIPGAEFKRLWVEREVYVFLMRQLTSSQATSPSGKFSFARKRCNYGSTSFDSKLTKDLKDEILLPNQLSLRLSLCTKSGYVVGHLLWNNMWTFTAGRNTDEGSSCTDTLIHPQRPRGDTVRGVFLHFRFQRTFPFLLWSKSLPSRPNPEPNPEPSVRV